MLRCEIIGTIGADAVFKQIDTNCYVSFRAAHNDNRINDKGEKIETTVWMQILYKSSNPKLLESLKKGTRIYARGFFNAHIYDSAKLHCKAIAYSMYASELEICSIIKEKDTQTIPF